MVDRTRRVDQAAELSALTGLDFRFGSFMPYQGGAYGMAVLSRLPIVSTTNVRLPDGAEPRTALAVTVELPRSGAPLTFVGIHFYRTEAERMAQAEGVNAFLAEHAGPAVLAGDFNSVPGPGVMDYLSSRWSLIDKGEDAATFPSWAPEREIDFVLVRPANRFEVVSESLLDEPVVSDHRPVVVDLVIRN